MVSLKMIVYLLGTKNLNDSQVTIGDIVKEVGKLYGVRTNYNNTSSFINKFPQLFKRTEQAKGRYIYGLSEAGKRYFEKIHLLYDPYTDTMLKEELQ